MALNYNDDSPTYTIDFDEFFRKFDADILPLCKTDKQVKRLRRMFYETRLFNL